MWMFHGVMAALEFLVLSVPVRIGVEQLPLPLSPAAPSPFLRRALFSSCVYMTQLFLFYTDDISVVLTKKQEFAFITITYSNALAELVNKLTS